MHFLLRISKELPVLQNLQHLQTSRRESRPKRLHSKTLLLIAKRTDSKPQQVRRTTSELKITATWIAQLAEPCLQPAPHNSAADNASILRRSVVLLFCV